MSEVLQATDVLDNSTQLSNLDYGEALDALIAGAIDVVSFPSQLDGSLLQRVLNAPEVRLMSIARAEAIFKIIPGLKHVVLWRGLISLSRDIPNSDVDLLRGARGAVEQRRIDPDRYRRAMRLRQRQRSRHF
jgi:hypothetical protein